MTDICKCEGTNCQLKEKCFRYKAPESYFQSYFLEVPLNNDICEYFIKIFIK